MSNYKNIINSIKTLTETDEISNITKGNIDLSLSQFNTDFILNEIEKVFDVCKDNEDSSDCDYLSSKLKKIENLFKKNRDFI